MSFVDRVFQITCPVGIVTKQVMYNINGQQALTGDRRFDSFCMA
jgi:hypothetical protein